MLCTLSVGSTHFFFLEETVSLASLKAHWSIGYGNDFFAFSSTSYEKYVLLLLYQLISLKSVFTLPVQCGAVA